MADIKGFLFGHGVPGPSTSENNQSQALSQYFGQTFGAPKTGNDRWGNPIFDWEKSNIGQPANVKDANSQYDYSPQTDAIAGYRKPANFDYADQSKIDEATNNQSQLGDAEINQAGKDNLTNLQEAIGTRRPGLILKAGENNGRDVAKTLAQFHTGLRTNAINKGLDLNKSQQEDTANNTLANLGGLSQTGTLLNSQEASRTNEANAERDKAIQDLYNNWNSQYTTRSQIKPTGGNLGAIVGAAEKVAGAAAPFFV